MHSISYPVRNNTYQSMRLQFCHHIQLVLSELKAALCITYIDIDFPQLIIEIKEVFIERVLPHVLEAGQIEFAVGI